MEDNRQDMTRVNRIRNHPLYRESLHNIEKLEQERIFCGDVYKRQVQKFPLDIKVAVMGCVVNGPGEAKEADIGIAGGKGVGLLIKKGEIIRKVPEAELLDVLRLELENWEK